MDEPEQPAKEPRRTMERAPAAAAPGRAEREAKLAAALRANLRRRKAGPANGAE